GVTPEADEIAHGTGGNEETGFAAEEFGGPLLKPVDCRIVPKDIVADLGRRHRLTHGRGRARDRVAPKIDQRFVTSMHARLLLSSRPGSQGENFGMGPTV